MKLSLVSLLPGSDRGWKSMYSVCAYQECQNTRLMRSVQSRGGISIGQHWYCSTDCFAVAARKRLSALVGDSSVEMRHSPRLSIGLIMVSKGYLTADQLRSVTTESQSRREELEVTLVRLRMANERQITAARAAQWGYPVLGQDRIGQTIECDIPPTLLRTYSAVPLHFSMAARRFLLGFVYRVEHSMLNSLEVVTEFRAEPCFITPTEFREQTERIITASDTEEVVFEDRMAPAHMAKNIGGFAVEIAAKEAHLVRCREYVWARLTGKGRKVDILFRVAGSPDAARTPRIKTRSNVI
jgi:hypothetical protein